MSLGVLQFHSWGFELYVPPIPFTCASAPARFVMLDDLNNVFYDVDYSIPALKNKLSWTQLALHAVADPAIVFPPEQQDMLHKQKPAIGILVSIESRDATVTTARKLGLVFVKRWPEELMNWSALRALKGKELPAEMRAGLLRHVWNRRLDADTAQSFSFVTPSRVLNGMPRPWHTDGVALNYELDERFAGGKAWGPPSRWKISDLEAELVEKSRTRAAVFIEPETDISDAVPARET